MENEVKKLGQRGGEEMRENDNGHHMRKCCDR